MERPTLQKIIRLCKASLGCVEDRQCLSVTDNALSFIKASPSITGLCLRQRHFSGYRKFEIALVVVVISPNLLYPRIKVVVDSWNMYYAVSGAI